MELYCNQDDPDGLASLVADLSDNGVHVDSQEIEIHRYDITGTISIAIELSISTPEIIAISAAVLAYLHRHRLNWISNHPTMGRLIRSDSIDDLPKLLTDARQTKLEPSRRQTEKDKPPTD